MVKILKKRAIYSNWLVLPPFTPLAGGSEIRKLISSRTSDGREKDSAASPSTTALKWILKCCPQLPRSLVQKLFGLKQVRRESSNAKMETHRPKRSGFGINRSLDVLASKYLRYMIMKSLLAW